MGEQANTLDRIVKDKEGIRRRLEEEEKEFLNKKREAERKMIEFEKQVENSFAYRQKVAQDAAAVQVPEFSDFKNEVASKENLQLTPPDLQHFNAIDDYDIYYDEWTPILS